MEKLKKIYERKQLERAGISVDELSEISGLSLSKEDHDCDSNFENSEDSIIGNIGLKKKKKK